jgi:hypothetical protein
MIGNRNGSPAGRVVRRALPLELQWDARHRPMPVRWVIPKGRRARVVHATDARPTGPLDFCGRMRRVCEDIADRCETFHHVRMPSVLLTFTPCRNRSLYGLQARVTPLRFRDGRLTRRHGPVEYQVQRFVVDGSEMLYILTFCLPRFLDQPFEEKLVTVFHELYHMSPAFDGDLRRHPGRYAVHSHSKACYDARMAELVAEYVANHPEPELFDFLRPGYQDLWDRHGGITGAVVPRPKLLPVGWATPRLAARARERQ